MDEAISTKFDLLYADAKVVFTISSCSTDKRYSFYQLDRSQSEYLIKRLKYLEQLTWKQFANLSRVDGVTCERPNSEGYAMIQEQDASPQRLVEPHYFHIRVEKTGLFRIFGYQSGPNFYITHFDPKGNIQHP